MDDWKHRRLRRDLPHQFPRVRLEIVRGRARQRFRDVHVAAYLVGSADDCDLVLADVRIPEVHAYLIRHRGGVSLRYLGNKPALTVNGRLIRHTELHDGDRIATGGYELMVHVEQGDEPDATPRGAGFERLHIDRRRKIDRAASARAEVESLRLVRLVRGELPEATSSVRVFQGRGGRGDTSVAV